MKSFFLKSKWPTSKLHFDAAILNFRPITSDSKSGILRAASTPNFVEGVEKFKIVVGYFDSAILKARKMASDLKSAT